MNDDFGRAIGVVVASAFGLAVISVIFSSRAQTAAVITSGGNALSGIIGAAVAPVTGGSTGAAASLASASGIASNILGGAGP